MYFVYVLKSLADGNLYIGKTNDVQRRLIEHNSGQTRSLVSRRPLILLETRECGTEPEARVLEKELKKGHNRKILRKKYCQ